MVYPYAAYPRHLQDADEELVEDDDEGKEGVCIMYVCVYVCVCVVIYILLAKKNEKK